MTCVYVYIYIYVHYVCTYIKLSTVTVHNATLVQDIQDSLTITLHDSRKSVMFSRELSCRRQSGWHPGGVPFTAMLQARLMYPLQRGVCNILAHLSTVVSIQSLLGMTRSRKTARFGCNVQFIGLFALCRCRCNCPKSPSAHVRAFSHARLQHCPHCPLCIPEIRRENCNGTGSGTEKLVKTA